MKNITRMIKFAFRAVLPVLVVVALTSTVKAQTERIAFQSQVAVSKRASYSQIFSMNPDGSDVVQLTSGSANASAPSWSPGQQYLAFWRNSTLWVMQATGEASGGKSFAVASGESYGSAWSPNSSATEAMLVFRGNPANLYTVAINPGALTAGTPVLFKTGYYYHPSWSPDGTKIAANGSDDGTTDVIKVFDAATGAVLASFGAAANYNFAPQWSPDGSLIAFTGPVTTTTTTTGKNGKTTTTTVTYQEIFLANADGTGITQVTDWNGNIAFPTWSPDGTTLAFYVNDGLYKMVLGSNAATLLYSGGNNPDWSP